MIQRVSRDPRPRVPNAQKDLIRPVLSERQSYLAARGCKLRCILQQVADHLCEPGWVTIDGELLVEPIEAEFDTCSFEEAAVIFDRAMHELRQRHQLPS